MQICMRLQKMAPFCRKKCMQRACSKIGREGEPAIISVTQERFPKSERLPPFELQTNPVGGRGPPSKKAG
jgi:hypothetical protein